MNLTDAHVLITGASRGIGAAMASDFHAAGARVTLVARDEARLTAIAEPLQGTVVPADLVDEDARAAAVDAAVAANGPVDVLINNAGIDASGAFWDLEPDDLQRLVNLNVVAVMDLTRRVLPSMIERNRGHIVVMSSMASVAALPGLCAYASTKAAVSMFASGLRADLKGHDIGVTSIQPGFVEPTDMADAIMDYAPTKAARSRLRRLGILPDVDRDALARDVVKAVQSSSKVVIRPRRGVTSAGLVEIPRRMVSAALRGVAPRTKTD